MNFESGGVYYLISKSLIIIEKQKKSFIIELL